MKRLTTTLIAGAVALAIGYGGALIIPHSRIQTVDNHVDLTDSELIARGAYIAKLADCAACHTVPGEKSYAGGLAMQTPLGAIYSTNITPDKTTGIGDYSLQEFNAAVKHGVRKDKSPLYPAMPYVSYGIMPDDEIKAMYAYFMTQVTPVAQENAPSTFPRIMSMRWPVAYWQALFAPSREFVADTALSADVNRGAYLVEGPGHCGACHTPRGVGYQELTLSDKDNSFLSGAVIDGWRAKSLRGEAQGLASWSQPEIVEFLKTGRTDKVAAFGAMADVIEHSSQYWSDEDLNATASYLKQLSPAKNKALQLPEKKDTTTEMLLSGNYTSRGAVLYAEYCYTCHRADGAGVPRIFPALNQNTAIYAQNPQSVIQVTLEGARMPHTPADKMAFAMPGFKNLSDEDVASVVNFIRTGWNNTAPEVSAQDVAKTRHFVNNKAPNIKAATGGSNE